VEDDGILLIDQRSGRSRRLHDSEAALWDLMSRGYSYVQIVAMISAIGSLPAKGAEQLVRSSLAAWLEEGFLERERPDGQHFDH
jgi:hypothetical protein